MSIEKLFFAPRLVHQTPDDDMDIAEPPVAVHHDSTPVVVISQEGRDIVLNRASINDLCKALKQVKVAAQEYQEARNG
ncbi:hypothetical protein ACEK07_45880 [Alcanivoracaceae bacterium MT1]